MPATNSSGNTNCKKWNLKMIFSLIGVMLGLTAFITFFTLSNYEAGVWGFASFVCASIVLYLHYLDNNDLLRQRYEPVDFLNMQIIGVVATLAGFSGIVWDTFIYFYDNIPVLPVSTSAVISMVWAFMTFKWGAALTYYTFHYKNTITQPEPPLL